MADKISKSFNLDDFLNQEIPAEVAEKLRVAGRIEQILKPTRTSAVSTSAQEEIPNAEINEVEREIDELIDHVADMEDLVEQLEDMVDDHLKDMAIPPVTERVANAAKRMGSTDGVITKPVLDQALLIMQIAPLLLTGFEPVGMALTGEAIVDPTSGSFLNCNEFTRSLVAGLEFLKNNDISNAEIPLSDLNQQIQSAHEDSLARMMLEIILKLIWNIIWVKLIVDHAIINPLRLIVGNPLDNIILFFKKECGLFRRPSSECRKKNGPVNIALDNLRNTLICKIPPKFYKRFNPMEHGVNCKFDEPTCPPQQASEGPINDGEKKILKVMEQIADELNFSECVNSDVLLGLARCTDPSGPGLPPECYDKALIVLQAILDDALNPSDDKSSETSRVTEEVNGQKTQEVVDTRSGEISGEDERKKGCLGGGYYAR